MEHDFGAYLEIARIQSEMNKMFDVLVQMRDEKGQSTGTSWVPSVDVCEHPTGLVVTCELPGVPLETLRVTALGGALTITGERSGERTHGEGIKFHVMERVNGRFRRVVPLGMAINTRDATAELTAGILRIHFPKVSNRRGEEVVIAVKAGQERS